MAKLLYRTEGILQQAGLTVPLLAARSDGACSRMARTTAISTYSSGPAAGLGLAAAEARRHGDAAVVGFDMGGTTLDLGLVRDGAYEMDEAPEIRGVRVRLPVPGITSVGLGGSSIASADSSGAVTVGPASAGAVPGPAAFGRGGAEPTLTDADVVAGLLGDGQALPATSSWTRGRPRPRWPRWPRWPTAIPRPRHGSCTRPPTRKRRRLSGRCCPARGSIPPRSPSTRSAGPAGCMLHRWRSWPA